MRFYSSGLPKTLSGLSLLTVDPHTPTVLGTELLTNGTFTGSATGWTLSGGAAYGTDNVNLTGSSTIAQDISVVSGQAYHISWVDTLTTGTITVSLGAVSVTTDYWKQAFATLVAATTGTVTLQITFSASGTVDTVSCKQLTASVARVTLGGAEFRSDTANSNLAWGLRAQQFVTTGIYNGAFGHDCQASLTTGNNNFGMGPFTQQYLTVGNSNVHIGSESGRYVTHGHSNLGMGYRSQRLLTSGSDNVHVGSESGANMTTSSSNVGIGAFSQNSTTTGYENAAGGAYSQRNLTTANSCSSWGTNSLRSITTGSSNTGVGSNVLHSTGLSPTTANATTTAFGQTAIGSNAGQNTATQRDYSTAVGFRASFDGANALALGRSTLAGAAGAVAIGTDSSGTGASTTVANEIKLGTLNHTVNVPGVLNFTSTPSFTVGGAGGASALPATPTGYVTVQVGGVAKKVPYYDV